MILEHPHQLMHNFCPFCQKKHVFFYFTHSFLQNTYISLSILHIYSIKYSKPSHHQPNQYPTTINDQYPVSIINPHNHHHQASLIINPPIKIPATINLINTHRSKSSKPTHQNHQNPTTINPINTQPPSTINTQPSIINPHNHQLPSSTHPSKSQPPST